MAWGLFPLFFAAARMDLAQIGTLAAIYPATWGIAQLFTGAWSDRVGRKWLIASGMWVQAVGIARDRAVASGFAGFAAGAALLGIGTAMVYPTLLAAIGDVAHPSWRASSVGVYRLWRDLGYAIGALLAGVTADALGLSAAMWLVAALTFASGLVVALRMRETLRGLSAPGSAVKGPFMNRASFERGPSKSGREVISELASSFPVRQCLERHDRTAGRECVRASPREFAMARGVQSLAHTPTRGRSPMNMSAQTVIDSAKAQPAPTQQDYQRLVESEWLPGSTAEAWGRWHTQLTVSGAVMTARLVEHARLRPGMHVLDLASGTGDPAITLARHVGPNGRVTGTDLSESMLAVARENARGIANLSFRVADAQSLPFDDESFDVVTCRLGIMYFVDLPKALREIRRVLKPGGRAVFAAWGPPGTDTYSAFLLGPFFARKELPPPPPDMPFPLRFAAPGSMADALRQVGLCEVEEQSAILPCLWPGTPEEAWRAFYDLAVPMRPYIDSFSREERAQAFQEALAILPKGGDPERTELTVSVNYAVATK